MPNEPDEKDCRIKELERQLGNLIDHWEALPNDIKSDPGMDNLNTTFNDTVHALEGP